MADLDTRDKRASAIGIDMAWNHVYPNESGGITTAALRQQVAYKYSGIDSTVVVGGFTPRLPLLGVG